MSEEKGNKEIDELRLQKLKEELKEEVKQELRAEGANRHKKNSDIGESLRISRRDFLKKAGLGTIGLAALGISPASALNIKSDRLTFSDNKKEYLNIAGGESASIKNADLLVENKIGIGTDNPSTSLDVAGTQGIRVPVGDNNQRSESPKDGEFRVNSEQERAEIYFSGRWENVGNLYNPIRATGGEIREYHINGIKFREHRFTGNEDYIFEVQDLGDSNGLVYYEIVSNGYETVEDADNPAKLSQLVGTSLRKIDPFFDDNQIFTYTSKEDADSLNIDTGTEGGDDTVLSEAEVNGSCVTNQTFSQAMEKHFSSGGRMPTLEDYINNSLKGSGCGHDNELCWTVTKGRNNTRHWLAPGRDAFDRFGGTRPEDNTFDNGFLRNIADVDINRPDPVLLQDDLVLEKLQENDYSVTVVEGPKVEEKEYNLSLGSGVSTAIPNTGPQSTDSKSGVNNQGDVVIRYPLEKL